IQQLLKLRHKMNLAAALEDIDALLGRDHRVAVEVGGALLELGEVLDRPQRALRAEEPLDIDSAQGCRLDAATVRLWADVADQMGRAIRMAVDVAIETGHSFARLFRPPVFQSVELLLRELRQQQTQAFELFRIED